jgi:hypothetical protein
MRHDVFISYSNREKPIAEAACTNIEATSARCRIALHDIAPGEDWTTALTKTISQGCIMMLVFHV